MRIPVELELSSEDKQRLATILRCDEEALPETLQDYALAALHEYVSFFLGRRVFTRGGDFLEYRLFLLIREAFKDEIPSEHKVSLLFQTTASQSRSLIRSVLSKYQYELRDAIKNSLKSVLSDVTRPDPEGDYEIKVNSRNLVDAFNEILSEHDDGTAPRVMLKARSVSTYTMKPSAYNCLCDHLDLERKFVSTTT